MFGKRKRVIGGLSVALALTLIVGGIAFAQGGPGNPGGGGMPGHPGHPGMPGHPGNPGQPGMPGHPGHPGMPGHPGQPGQPPDEPCPGMPGHPGHPGEGPGFMCGLGAGMRGDPEWMDHMRRMMNGEIDPAECAEWMSEHGVPPELQAECLARMARFKDNDRVDPAPLPDPRIR